MKEDKKHLDIDLEFLDKKDSSKTPKTKVPTNGSSKYDWKNILIIGVAVLFFGWLIFSANNSNTNTSSTSTNTPVVNDQAVTSPTMTPVVDVKTPIVPKAKTNNQICKENYGSHSYATGNKNVDGGPECDCQSGYTWDSTQTTCIVAPPPPKTGYEICRDRNGPYATYDSATNSCGCESDYSLGATSKQCVSFTAARDESCAASYPGTSFLKYDTASGKNICDCQASYYWNNDKTACYNQTTFDQSCVNSYGQGSYSTTQYDGKRVCDCSYGYSWNAQRNMCVTTASINAMCERDVGRNSTYDGTVTNGKYNCTQPY